MDNAQIWLVFCPGWYTPIMVALMLVLAVSQLLEKGKAVENERGA